MSSKCTLLTCTGCPKNGYCICNHFCTIEQQKKCEYRGEIIQGTYDVCPHQHGSGVTGYTGKSIGKSIPNPWKKGRIKLPWEK